jgi:GcrA cell cycle regulator
VTRKLEWTPAELAVLKSEWEKGSTGSAIARMIRGATRSAILGKASRIGLPPRGSPIGRNKVTDIEKHRKKRAERAAKEARRAAASAQRESIKAAFWTDDRLAVLRAGYSRETMLPVAEIARIVGCGEWKVYEKARDLKLVHPMRFQRRDGRPGGGVPATVTRIMSERLAERAPKVAPDSLGLTLDALKPGACRFPTSPHMARQHLFCGADVAGPGLPYCPYHHAVAFRRIDAAEDGAPLAQAAE